ncbi:unnamed protein product [Amoebophrya sp. A25]|nr:unnamed protein product [Amoebophrya sp. A25]|eukprot:GSA25T00021022001.1
MATATTSVALAGQRAISHVGMAVLANLSSPARRVSRFLPYEAWLHYVRCTGMQRVMEYRNWAKSAQRPRNIPSRPDHVYKQTGEWKGWPVAFGTSYGEAYRVPLSREALLKARESSPRAGREWATAKHELAIEWFLQCAEKHTGDLEFRQVHSMASPHLFVRRRSQPHGHDAWVAIQLKSARSLAKKLLAADSHAASPKNSVPFTGIFFCPDIVRVFVCQDLNLMRIVLPQDFRPSSRRTRTARSSNIIKKRFACAKISFDPKHNVDSADFSEFSVLEEALPSLALRTEPEWREKFTSCMNRTILCHEHYSRQTSQFLYRLAGLHAKNAVSAASPWNLQLGRYKCAQKVVNLSAVTASSEYGVRATLARDVYGHGLKFGIERISIACDISDGVHFYIFVLRRNDLLSGVFVFPSNFLLEYGHISDCSNEKRGKKAIMLYPPGNSSAKRNKRFAAAQQQFYIALEDKKCAPPKQVSKLLSILDWADTNAQQKSGSNEVGCTFP